MNKKTEEYLLQLVRDNYREIAAEFDLSRRKQLWDEVVKFAAEINCSLNRKSVLDAGCGNGRLFKLFQNKNIDYLGVDSCPELIGLAQMAYEEAQPTPQFAVGEILTLSQLPQFNFDYIFCVGVLHHLPGVKLQAEALRQLKSKLKDNGQIFLSVWNIWRLANLRPLIFKFSLLKLLGKHQMDWGDIIFDWKYASGEAASQRYYHAFTKRQLKRLARQAGLKVLKLWRDHYNYYLILKK